MHKSNFAITDAAKVINKLGINNPKLTKALAVLGVEPQKKQRKHANNTRSQIANDNSTSDITRNEAQIEKTTILDKNKDNADEITTTQTESERIKKIQETRPINLNTQYSYNETLKPIQLFNEKEFWQKAANWLQMTGHSHILDINILCRKIAKRTQLQYLPYRKQININCDTWLYLDLRNRNWPLLDNFEKFTEQLKRHISTTAITRIIEITANGNVWYWRDKTHNDSKINITNNLPLPFNKQRAIILADAKYFSGTQNQDWLNQLRINTSDLTLLSTRTATGWLNFEKSSAFINNNNLYSEQIAHKTILAILSITPARFTLAMVRELRLALTSGSSAIETDIYDDPQLIWSKKTGNGYWQQPSASHRLYFKTLDASDKQLALKIIDQHLPKNTPSLRFEHLMLTLSLNDPDLSLEQAVIDKAKHYITSLASALLTPKTPEVTEQKLLNYLYLLSNRFNSQIADADSTIKAAITIANFHLKKRFDNFELTQGIDLKLLSFLEEKPNYFNDTTAKTSFEALSVKHQEICRLIAQGASNQEICKRLFIHSNAINEHIQSIYNQLNISGRSDVERVLKLFNKGRQRGNKMIRHSFTKC